MGAPWSCRTSQRNPAESNASARAAPSGRCRRPEKCPTLMNAAECTRRCGRTRTRTPRNRPSQAGGLTGRTVRPIRLVREVEPRISADMRAIERENAYGGWLEGFEFRLKGEDRIKEKITEKLEAEPRITSAE